MLHIAKMFRLFFVFVLTMPILTLAAEYEVRPDPRDCAGFPQCGGFFLYETIQTTQTAIQPDLCTADLQYVGYVVKCMCIKSDGSLVEFVPSCDKPVVGAIEPDFDYEDYSMLVSPSCGQ
jgi:hypothetical protein